MDRDDGQDIRHYNSVEAIDPMQDAGDSASLHARSASSPDTIRDANDIAEDEVGLPGPVSDTLPADEVYGSVDNQTVADTYGEATASQDFDPDADALGMGTDESDNMLSDD